MSDVPNSGGAADVSKLPEKLGRQGRAQLFQAIVMAVFLSITAAILIWVVPKLGIVFQQIKVSIPSSTDTLLSLSNLLRRHPWTVPPAIIVIPWILARRKKPLGRKIECLMDIGFVVILGWIVLSLFLPLVFTLY